MKAMKTVRIGIALAAVGMALILQRAQAVPGEPGLRPNEQLVDIGDPIMKCAGDKRRSSVYSCGTFAQEVLGNREINLPSEKVTDDVAGCHPGSQPSVAKQISYAKTTSVSVNAQIKFDLKILTGAKGMFSKIKEYQPSIGGGLAYSWATTFGEAKTSTIPADYGKISWGIFSQKAREATVNQTVVVRNTHIAYNDSYLYTAKNFKIVTPIEEEKTKFPVGTLAKDQRNFNSVAEFKELCPNGVLPDYLRGKSSSQ